MSDVITPLYLHPAPIPEGWHKDIELIIKALVIRSNGDRYLGYEDTEAVERIKKMLAAARGGE